MSFPQWKGLWDWSMKYADGSAPSSFRPEDVDPNKMKWLDEALKHYMIDFSARMKEIKTKLERDTTGDAGSTATGSDQGPDQGPAPAGGNDLEEQEALLDELMDIVSAIDYARDLHKIGGLPVLMELLDSPHPSLRWRAAEVVATCVANNPPVQQWFLEGGVLPKLLHLTAASQPDVVRTKALLALSGLLRHYAEGLQALRAAGGIAAVVSCVASPDRRLARKAMTILAYMLGQVRADCRTAMADGALPPLLAALAAGDKGAAADGAGDGSDNLQDDSDLRQAALAALLQLGSYPGTWEAVRDAPGLRGRLVELERMHAALSAEDQDAQREELGLLTQLERLLAAPAAPPLLPDQGDHVTPEAFEEAGRDLTFTVNEPAAAGAGTTGDAGAGAGDQGAAAGPASGQAASGQAAAPLLLGPP